MPLKCFIIFTPQTIIITNTALYMAPIQNQELTVTFDIYTVSTDISLAVSLPKEIDAAVL